MSSLPQQPVLDSSRDFHDATTSASAASQSINHASQEAWNAMGDVGAGAAAYTRETASNVWHWTWGETAAVASGVEKFGTGLARENQDVVTGIAQSYKDAEERISDHIKERPTTASIEQIYPPLLIEDGLTRGRTQSEIKAQEQQVHAQQAHEQQAHQQPVHALQAHEQKKSASLSNGKAKEPMSKSADTMPELVIKSGDSYWSIAKSELEQGATRASNKDVALLATELGDLNDHRQLRPGMHIATSV